MSPWLKSGLIGALALIIINLVGIIPLAGCCTFPLTIIAFFVIGLLAAHWMEPPRDAGPAAGQGTLAALIAGIVSGVMVLLITLVQTSLTDMSLYLQQIPPEIRAQMFDATGIPPRLLFGVGGGAIFGSMCCGFEVILAVALGAFGGAIYAAIKSD
jgi:hypothetical protein